MFTSVALGVLSFGLEATVIFYAHVDQRVAQPDSVFQESRIVVDKCRRLAGGAFARVVGMFARGASISRQILNTSIVLEFPVHLPVGLHGVDLM